MMREMMVAASLVVAACGAVEPLDTATDPTIDPGAGSDAGNGSGSDSGSAMGSGSGSDPNPLPAGCTKASECGLGLSCDVAAQQCVPVSLTLSSTGFFDDGTRFWTNTHSPSFSGTYAGPPGSVVRATIGAVDVVVTMSGTEWSTSAPSNPALGIDGVFMVEMTDPSGGATAIEQRVTFDTVPPAVAFMPTTIADERLDSIEWTDNGPIHTHTGTGVTLGSSGCPDVYKHPYLMNPIAPAYGSEANANALVWRATVADAGIASIQYRVRSATSPVKPWVALPVGPQITIPLVARGATTEPHRLAALNSFEGELFVDISVVDWAGIETVATACWNHHPLAAPLEIEQARPASGTDSLMSWGFATDSPISRLVETSAGVKIVEQKIVQHTAEWTYVALQAGTLTGSYVRESLNGIVSRPLYTRMPCTEMTNGVCGADAMPLAPMVTSSGVLDNHSLRAVLVDDVSGQVVAQSDGNVAMIPPRDGAPRSYTMSVYLDQVTSLRPSPDATTQEHELYGQPYTGTPATNTMFLCSTGWTSNAWENGGWVYYCDNVIQYDTIAALDRVQLDLSYAAQLTTGAYYEAMSVPHNVPWSTFMASVTWDSGNDDLPGAN